MQKLIAKYGAAAHLAILAVAPLFLFPFFGTQTVATVILWLSVPAFLWVFLEPSLRWNEALHDARGRVVSSVIRDPLFWTMLLIVLFAGIRALNSGVGMAYDAEQAKWYVKTAFMPIFPGAVGDTGYLPFASVVALTVILIGCRHSLGQSARVSFLFVSSALAGAAALVAVVLLVQGNRWACEAAGCSKSYSYVGVAWGIYLLAGTVATALMFERKWNKLIPFAILSIGGTGAGAFVYSPAAHCCVVAGGEILLLVYVFCYLCRVVEGARQFKFLVVSGIALTLGALSVAAMMPDSLLQEKLSPFVALSFFDESFFKLRAALSAVAVKAWLSHIWIGTGLSSFPLDFRFAAEAADWTMTKGGAVALANGWLLLLVERGIIGAVVLLVPCGFLTVSFFRRFVLGLAVRTLPQPACLLYPLTFVALVLIGIVDCSLWRTDVLLVTGALWAVSARSFPVAKRSNHG